MSTLGIINLPVFMFAVLLLNVTPGRIPPISSGAACRRGARRG